MNWGVKPSLTFHDIFIFWWARESQCFEQVVEQLFRKRCHLPRGEPERNMQDLKEVGCSSQVVGLPFHSIGTQRSCYSVHMGKSSKVTSFHFIDWHSQRWVVGASHSKQPLQGVGSVRVLHRALCLQVSDQQRNGLQQVLFGQLGEKNKASPVKRSSVMFMFSEEWSETNSHLASEDHNILDGICF